MYPYALTLSVLLERGDSEEFTAAQFFAGDSDGLLWSLDIAAAGPLSTPSSVDINFQLNPQAKLRDGQNQSLNSDAIVQALRQALVISGGVAVLSGYDLFPPGTMYVVETETSYTFGAEAAVGSLDARVVEP